MALCLFLFLLAPINSYAGTTETPGPAFEILEEILSSEDFGGEKEGWGIRFRHQNEPKPLPEFNIAPWVDLIKKIFAVSLRMVLALAILTLIVFSVVCILRLKSRGGRLFRKRINTEARTPGPNNKNPELLLEQARSLYACGKLREAWAACFAAVLSAWSSYRRLSFPVDATEFGCLALVRDAAIAGPGGTAPVVHTAEVEEFGGLILNWVAFAYGGKIPADAAFDKALGLCESLGVRHG
jgi:hypothetical protein